MSQEQLNSLKPGDVLLFKAETFITKLFGKIFNRPNRQGIVIKLWGELYVCIEKSGYIYFFRLEEKELRDNILFDTIYVYSPNKTYSTTEQDKISKYVVQANKKRVKTSIIELINKVRSNTIQGAELGLENNKYYKQSFINF